jgi:hypothetical protein
MREIHGWGGWRPGSGRKKGSKNRRSAASTQRYRDIAAEAREHNMTPLDYMLAIVRDPSAPEHRRDEMAWRSAPYVHPKLSSHRAQYDMRGEIAGDVHIDQINIVAVESGRFLTKEEIEQPIIEVLPGEPEFLALELEAEPDVDGTK